MATSEQLLEDLIGLPQAAERLRVHRATVNDMVISGRLRGHRLGAHWYVRRSELEIFARSYQRPKNSRRRRNSGAASQYWAEELLRWLYFWNDATSEELDRVLDLHIGNIRKYLAFCQQDGLAERDELGYWRLTPRGTDRAKDLPTAGTAGCIGDAVEGRHLVCQP